jgi:glycine cleavage system regulatory protein
MSGHGPHPLLGSDERAARRGIELVHVSLVLTLIGPDRPGIVGRLARLLASHEGNWLESRMAHLAGQFAGILRADVPAERADELTAALAALEAEGLRVAVARDADAPQRPGRHTVRLELVGNDRPGIVRDIFRVLAERDVNVEELVTECEDAPMTGGRLFRAAAELRVPRGLTLDELHRTLEALANDLMVEIHLDDPQRP